jgi:divalent metal cation (Fe/Co/Zn/Cd) transporter
MKDWVEVVAGDKDQKYRRAALVLRTLGWTSIIWAAGVSVWIWMGWRAGANLWLWSAIGLFAIGVALLFTAWRLQLKALQLMVTARRDPRLNDEPRLPHDKSIKAA